MQVHQIYRWLLLALLAIPASAQQLSGGAVPAQCSAVARPTALVGNSESLLRQRSLRETDARRTRSQH